MCFARIQVQNKLDGCYYAVKRIQVNPASKQFRRIKGEVTLLSRLNHENIVRYYNAWIERHELPATGVLSNTDSSEPLSSADKAPQRKNAPERVNELGLPDNVEDIAPPPALSSSVEWSTSIERSSSARCSGRQSSDDEDDDDDDDDEEDVFGASFLYVFFIFPPKDDFLLQLLMHHILFLFFPLRPSNNDSRSDIIFDNGDESMDEMSKVPMFSLHLLVLLCLLAFGVVHQPAGVSSHR